jgi:hypothetical protein
MTTDALDRDREREELRRWARRNRAKQPCPACGEEKGLPIIWGMALSTVGELADQGELVMGGCVVFGDPDRWRCASCGHGWRVHLRLV